MPQPSRVPNGLWLSSSATPRPLWQIDTFVGKVVPTLVPGVLPGQAVKGLVACKADSAAGSANFSV